VKTPAAFLTGRAASGEAEVRHTQGVRRAAAIVVLVAFALTAAVALTTARGSSDRRASKES
jgi:hypothetical protein